MKQNNKHQEIEKKLAEKGMRLATPEEIKKAKLEKQAFLDYCKREASK